MNYKTLSLLLMTLLSLSQQQIPSSAQTSPTRITKLPRFRDYPASNTNKRFGEVIAIDRWTEEESMANYNKRIRRAAKKGTNFAGHYAIVGSSCGMICVNLSIVDTRTGRVYRTPFIGITNGPCPKSYYAKTPKLIEFRTDSRLLILRGAAEDPDKDGSFHDAPCSTRYYVWKRNKLVLAREVLYK